MDTYEIVQGFLEALEAGDFETVASYLADDFEFSSHTQQEPLGPQQWLGVSRTLKAGIPDLSYNFQIKDVEANRATVSVGFSGTHTHDLDLTPMGIGVIPATGAAISTRPESSEGVVDENGRIRSIHVHDSHESGMTALLAQIGVQPPM